MAGGVLISDVVQDALSILGEVLGVDTQTYEQPRMIIDAGRAFNMLFKKRFWGQYTKWQTVILDGATGKITTNAFTNVHTLEDFAAVHRAGYERPLPRLREAANPNVITGTVPVCWNSLINSDADYVNKKIIIYPIAATGSLDVRARYHPKTNPSTAWAGTDELFFDRDLLALATAFQALSGDDLNPSAKQDAQEMMDTRYSDITSALDDQAMQTGPRSDVPRTWFSQP